jgi:ribosome maturation factor RimP
MRTAPRQLSEIIRAPVEAMGYELVGVQLFRKGRSGLVLRVYIDREGGITLDDCSSVSHQVSGVLDVEDPIAENYDLEVSSPGLDRPLFEPEHFRRFAGRRARLQLRVPVEGRKKMDATLTGFEGDAVTVETEAGAYRIPLEQIDSARLVPDI